MRARYYSRMSLFAIPPRPARKALPHPGHDRARRSAEARRQGRDQPVGGRAGFRYAGAHSRGRHRRDQGGPHPLHQFRRRAGTEGRHHRQVPARQRPHLRAQPDPGFHRRQADAVQPVHGRDQSGRRSDHSRAVLGVVSGHGAAGRRPAGHAHRQRRTGLQDHAAPAGGGDHAEDPAGAVQQPEQPHRRRLHPRRARGAGRSAAASTRAC